MGVNNAANRHRYVVGTNTVEYPLCITTLNQQFGHQAHVHQYDALTRRFVFGGAVFKPILATPRVLHPGFNALRRKPVRIFPAAKFSKVGPGRSQPVVQRRLAGITRRLILVVGPIFRHCQAQHFHGPVTQVFAVVLIRRHTLDVYFCYVNIW